ncbi:hypothetical protein SEA_PHRAPPUCCINO_102 [Mycobacterium phage Phrappuccino]|uniref:DUF732 domain-containing protein n=1 Tax=Mycobacterium phage Phrappuccino TaxID=2591223 RepID=A0A514DDV5_9CAUD|nr:hypothetical protein KHQ87_gp102 [Mycobacterium phage Phrappuccino]QDH91777.1 hypothetical protein SEA_PHRAPPUCCINO_102 [Mycobacterium phage Phrappuccino]QIQ63219.1 hypothetical protein SEA_SETTECANDELA_102 [Mycobacterium phage Settecandela]
MKSHRAGRQSATVTAKFGSGSGTYHGETDTAPCPVFTEYHPAMAYPHHPQQPNNHYNQQYNQQYYPPQPPPRRKSRTPLVLALVALAAVVAVVAVVIAYATSSDSSTQSVDQAYLEDLRDIDGLGISVNTGGTTDEALIKEAHQVCSDLGRGVAPIQLAYMLTQFNAGQSVDDAYLQISSAVKFYCPDQKTKLRAELMEGAR